MMTKSKIEPVDADEAANFEPWDPKYRCCCGSVHVKQGALIVGILTFVLILYSLFIISVNLGLGNVWNWTQIVFLCVDLFAVSLMLYGVVAERHQFLLPFLIYSLYSILLLIFGISIAIYCWFWSSSAKRWFPMEALFERRDWTQPIYDEEKAIKMAATLIGISCLFSLIISVWWAWVVWKCYKFLRTINRLKVYLTEWERRKYLPLQLDN